MDAHPNVKIVHNKAATTATRPARTTSRSSARHGLADIEAIEVDWLPEVMQYADLLAPSRRPEEPLARLQGGGRDEPRGQPHRLRHRHRARGRLLPLDLFAAAGLPTDRAEVAKLLEGDGPRTSPWVTSYVAATGRRSSTPPAAPTRVRSTRSRPRTRTPTVARSPPRRTPRSRRSTTRCSRPAPRSRRTSASGPTTGSRVCPTARSRRCSARAGCSVSSRATPRRHGLGTIANVFPAAPATGAART